MRTEEELGIVLKRSYLNNAPNNLSYRPTHKEKTRITNSLKPVDGASAAEVLKLYRIWLESKESMYLENIVQQAINNSEQQHIFYLFFMYKEHNSNCLPLL